MTTPTPAGDGPATLDALHHDVKAVIAALAGGAGGGGGSTIDTSTLAKDATLVSVRDALLGGTGKVQSESISPTTPLAWTVTRGDYVNTPDAAVTDWYDPVGAWPNFILPASLDGLSYSLFVESEVPDAYGNLTHATILPVVGQVADPVTGDSIDLSQRTGLNQLITLAVQTVTPKRVRLGLSAHTQDAALPATMVPVDAFTADTEKPLWVPVANMVVSSAGRAASAFLQSGDFKAPAFDGAYVCVDNSGSMFGATAGSLGMLAGPLVRYTADGAKSLSFDGSFDTTHAFVHTAMQQYGMLAWTATDASSPVFVRLTAYAPAI